MQRLFKAAGTNRRRRPKLDANTFRTLVLLLFGAGQRSGEARRLTVAGVDLDSAALAVNASNFHKSRLVPVSAELAGVLRRYAAIRAQRPLRKRTTSTFLACRDESPPNKSRPDLKINVLDYWETNPNGKRQHFTRVTDLPVNPDTVMRIMRAGRARWRVENETFNTLKN